MSFFLKGMFIGLIFGVPAGAVGALTVRRTIAFGRMAGFLSGLGCSAADLCYCGMSIFGFTLVSDFMLKYQNLMTLLGGLLIVAMGVGLIRKNQPVMREAVAASKLLSFFVSSFLIAAANPATIVTFLLAFSIFGLGRLQSAWEGVGTAFGILSGACIWWMLIALIAGGARTRITQRTLKGINLLLGVLVLLFGAAVFIKSIHAIWA